MGREAKLSRRDLLCSGLSASAALFQSSWAAAQESASSAFTESVLSVPAESAGHALPRTTLLVPKNLEQVSKPLPLLILCHGLGESSEERLGLRAWTQLYGLTRAHERLSRPPLQRLFPKLNYLPEARLAELNAELTTKPLAPCVIACPFTPNPYIKGLDTSNRLERFGDFIERSLIPEIRRQLPITAGAEGLGLAGVSMGGYVALELVLRRPHLFSRVCSIQGAFGPPALARYKESLVQAKRAGALRNLLLLTSRDDPFRAAHERLSRLLTESALEHHLIVRPGPHNQPWLQEVGCLELLYWHDRAARLA